MLLEHRVKPVPRVSFQDGHCKFCRCRQVTKGRVAVILATAVKGGRAGLALDGQPAGEEVGVTWLQL